jgi:sugar phosphate isomerase/epimerase
MADQWPAMRAVAYRAVEWMDRLNSFCEKHCAKKDSADYTLHVEEVVRSCIHEVIEQNKSDNVPVNYFTFAIYERVWPLIKRKRPKVLQT